MVTIQVQNFNLAKTLESGQLFRFKKINPQEYIVQTQQNIARIIQNENTLEIHSNNEDEFFWRFFFDLDTNYSEIEKILSKDPVMKKIIKTSKGISIMKQNFYETIIYFIMSTTKQIPQIQQCIELFCEMYGPKIEFEGNIYYGFPNLYNTNFSVEKIRQCKVGFRDKAIYDAIQKIKSHEIDLSKTTTSEQMFELLQTIRGVGPKVANCVMLFGFHDINRFPIDTWIEQKMQQFYFKGEKVSHKIISEKAEELFGEYKGYAQQYMFYASIKKQI